MADVNSLFKKVLSAVHGKDVRQSIHDLIKTCYEELYSMATVKVSTKEPTETTNHLWINPEGKDNEFSIPEIKDDEINIDDTWSSKRISDRTSSVEIKWLKGSYVSMYDGKVITDDSTRMCTDYIPCSEEVLVSFIAETAHVNVAGISFYDADKKIIQQLNNIGENGVEHTVTSPKNTRFIRLSSATTIGWSLNFSNTPMFDFVGDYIALRHNFGSEVDRRIAYDNVINGISQKPYFINQSGITLLDDGSIKVAPGGYYFVTFAYGSFGGNAYVGIKYNRDERIELGFSENSSNTLSGAPRIVSEYINGYEVIRVDKVNEYDYPYAIVRIDNRGADDDMIIYDVKIVDGDKPLPNRPYYVSEDGSSTNDGTLEKPFASVNQALIAGASDIYILPGVYKQNINLVHSHHCKINISPYEADGRVIFRDPNAEIATSETKVSGYSKVYSVSTDRTFGTNNIWIFQDGISDETTLISDSERHPLQRGYKYRCEDTKIARCTATALGDALNEIESSASYKWFFDASSKTVYFSRPSAITDANPLCGSTATSLFLNADRNISLTVSGIECKYLGFDVSRTVNSVIKDCKASNVCKAGAFMYDQALSCEFIRCEASHCFSGTNGDGFNAHSSNTGDIHAKQTTVSLIDCWSHDNNDDGYSDHERSEITIIGGLFEYNGKAGVTPSYGSHCTCYNVLSRRNFAGFYYTGTMEEAEGGQYGQMYCSNCVAENNNRGGTKSGFRVDGAYNKIELVECKAIGNDMAYVIGNDLSTGKLIDCRAVSNNRVKVGTFEVVNTTTVS